MKVFISWSGELSKSLGEAIRIWLASALHLVKPYFTPDDIDKGARWQPEIAQELESADFGLICLTTENLERPWVMFEAGALAKKFTSSNVCPILFGVEPHQVQGPLSQFQCVVFSKNETKKLLKTLNSFCGDDKLEEDVLNNVFNKWWPQLNEQVDTIMKENAEAKPIKQPSQKEILSEILELSRMSYRINQKTQRSKFSVGGKAFAIISRDLLTLHNMCIKDNYVATLPILNRIARRIEKLMEQVVSRTMPNTMARLQKIQALSEVEENEEDS